MSAQTSKADDLTAFPGGVVVKYDLVCAIRIRSRNVFNGAPLDRVFYLLKSLRFRYRVNPARVSRKYVLAVERMECSLRLCIHLCDTKKKFSRPGNEPYVKGC